MLRSSAVLLLLAGCSRPSAVPAAPAEIITRDSAGVVIVEHPPDALNAAPRFRLGAPMLTLGSADGDGVRDMTFTSAALFVGPNRFVLVDHRAYRLTLFDTTGTPVASYGRRGEGPGEFRNRPVPFLAADGLLWLLDYPGRVIRLSPELQLRTDVALDVAPMSDEWLMPVGDGGVLAVRRAPILPRAVAEVTQRAPEFLVRLHGAVIDTLATWQGLEWYPVQGKEGGQSFVAYDQREFGRHAVVRVWGHRIVVGTNDGWAFDVRDSTGTVRLRVMLHETPLRTTETMRDSARARMRTQLDGWSGSEADKANLVANINAVRFADTVASYSDVLAAGDSALWVAETVVPTENVRRYAVFDAGGRLIRRVEMPARYRLLAADGDRVLVRRLDPNGVGYVDLSRLVAVAP